MNKQTSLHTSNRTGTTCERIADVKDGDTLWLHTGDFLILHGGTSAQLPTTPSGHRRLVGCEVERGTGRRGQPFAAEYPTTMITRLKPAT